MRRETIAVGRKTVGYLAAEPSGPAVRQRPLSALIFLHAFPLGAEMWHSVLDAIPDGWRGLAPVMRWEPGVTMNDLAGDVVDLLDHLGVAKAAIIGCSMGGYVAFEIMKSAPRYVSALGLVSTRPGADNEEGRRNRQKMIEQVDREGVESIANQMVPKLLGATTVRDRPALMAHVRSLVLGNTPERVKAAVKAMMERGDSTPVLAKIDVPTLIIHGAEDTLIPPSEAEAMHRAIRQSHLELIPLSGHLPNLEQPLPFERTLWQFLKNL